METDMEIEVRIAEVKAAVDLGNMQTAGSIALLIQGAATDRERLAQHQADVKAALLDVAKQRDDDQKAQLKKDEDQESRLRLVDPLPKQVAALTTAHQDLVILVGKIANQQSKWAGGAVVVSLLAGTLLAFILNHAF